MKIGVTKQDIVCGKRYRNRSCPVALAVRRQTKKLVIVDGAYLLVPMPDGRKRAVQLAPKVRKLIHMFDAGLPIKPFSFTLHGV